MASPPPDGPPPDGDRNGTPPPAPSLEHVQTLVFIIAVFGMAAYGLYYTTNLGKTPYIRRLAPLEAIEEGIGRAVEEAKSVHFGLPSANPQQAGTLANLSIMGYFAEKVATAGVPAFYTTAGPAHGLEIMKGILRERYTKAGKLDDFNNPTSFIGNYNPCFVRIQNGLNLISQIKCT